VNDRIWILLPAKSPTSLATQALELGFSTLVTEDDPAALAGLAKARVLHLAKDGLYEDGRLAGPRVEILDVNDQERALKMAGNHKLVVVDALDWRVIPYENLIAAYRQKKTKLAAIARDAQDAKLLLETLERGVDAVLLPAQHAREAAKLFERAETTETLAAATIVAIKQVGLGDRACLDTASLLEPDEGVLTGSSSHGLFLVASEAQDSGYVASRPFRVNAGAVHAYVLLPGGKTKYLSELKAGDDVLVCDRKGKTRSVVLGRVKIERRPFLLLEAEVEGGKRFSVLLQNAETIRLATPDGTKSVTRLASGEKLLVRLDEGGRHFGMSIDETIQER
jgi:3-dehydroquinate synthase II